ncbi:Endoglucanase B like protein [Verticillium longisporum]|nr:Endoglucanase B like protein [Verticillium longisporum]
MKSQIGFAALLALSNQALAQQTAYGQCGGNGWTGLTTCVSGYYCNAYHEWYSQCIPGQAPPGTTTTAPAPPGTTTSTRPATTSTTSRPATTSASTTSAGTTRVSTTTSSAPPPATTTSAGSCSSAFTSISAADYVDAISPGWNLGNTLDAIPNEGSWNNPPVDDGTFDHIVDAGFKSVRIPVTYTAHLTSGAPNWTVDPVWLQRVSDVIDQALARNLYVITNVHHDSWEWADVRSGDLAVIQQRFRAIWVQIAKKLACKSSRVSFESINEPPADNAVDGANVNKFNELFVSAVNEAGGHNAKRVLQLAGGVSDPIKTTQWFKAPANIQNPWALQFHYYSPYDFIFSAWGKTIWGSAADRAALTADFQAVRGNFSNVPLVLGEFDASPLNTEPAARWKWTDHLARIATDLGVALVIWDNGLDHLDRNTGVWRDPVSIALIEAAVAGERSSLPDSTEDAGASTQSSSAYLWNKVGNAVADQVLPWLFNGNTLTGITTQTGDALSAGSDYTVSSNAITFKAGFLSDYLGPNVTPGSKANLTLTFSAGAHSNIEVVQWDTPVLVTEPDATPGQDLQIPIQWKGVPVLAAVRAEATDGTILFDDWTQWLGPLQRGRLTFNNHYFWEGSNVILRASAIAAVLELNKAVKFTFEFYPRVAGNSVTYTLDPTDEC